MQKVTLKDVAKAAGVSYATVSRALSGRGEINEETRARIVALCREMNFTPNALARSMVMKRTNTIGLIMADINNPFMSEIAKFVEYYVRENGYDLMLCSSSYDIVQEKRAMELFQSRQVDGIIMIPAGAETYSAISPLLSRVPTVFVSESMNNLPVDNVAIDNVAGTHIGVDYLFNQGHRDILYLGRRPNSPAHELRAKGFVEACSEHGLFPSFMDSQTARSNQATGYELGKEYFSRRPLCHTAIYCATDSLAIGVMQAADEAGVRIPEDISLMGFDNISFTELPRINLTTIDQPKKLLAEAAVERLLERIDEETESECEHTVLMPTLVERKSVKKLA